MYVKYLPLSMNVEHTKHLRVFVAIVKVICYIIIMHAVYITIQLAS